MFFKSYNLNPVSVPGTNTSYYSKQSPCSWKGGEMNISRRSVIVTTMDAESRVSITCTPDRWLFWFRIVNPRRLGPWLGYLRYIQMKELFALSKWKQSTTYFSGQPTYVSHTESNSQPIRIKHLAQSCSHATDNASLYLCNTLPPASQWEAGPPTFKFPHCNCNGHKWINT